MTINDIQREMQEAGSHWFDHDTLRYFQCRVSFRGYEGAGGVYFVTSERCGDEPRRYTVRRYLPERRDIETVGEFNRLTRSRAHREARRLAGPEARVKEEPHRPLSTAEQLAHDIQVGGGECEPVDAEGLIRLATRHHRLMERECNVGDQYDGEGCPKYPLASLEALIMQHALACGCGVVLGGDPRGATVKLVLPNRKTNDWGREGWCVPTR